VIFLTPDSAAWHAAWGQLIDIRGDVDEGEGWQYMGSTLDAGRICHQFRNRNVPGMGRVVYDLYDDGDVVCRCSAGGGL